MSHTECCRAIAHWSLGIEDSRQWSPLIAERDWDCILRTNGFSGTDLVVWDHEDPRYRMSYAMASTIAATSDGLFDTFEFRIVVSGDS